MKKALKIVLVSILIVAVLGVIYVMFFKGTNSAVSVDATRYKITKGDMNITTVGNGKIVSSDIKTIIPNGTVTDINFKIGDPVKKGDILGKYVDMRGQVEDIVADYDGVLTSVPSAANFITGKAASSAFEISSTSKLQMDIKITENDIFKIKKGQSASVYIDALKKTVDGTVDRISYSGNTDQDLTVYTVTVSFDESVDNIFLGMSGSASIMIDNKKDVYKVPVEAIIDKDGKTYVLKSVWLDNQNKPKSDFFIEVKTGISDTDYVEISAENIDNVEIAIIKEERLLFPMLRNNNMNR